MGSDLFRLRRVSISAERSDPFARVAGNWGMSPFPFWRSLALGCAARNCQRFARRCTERARPDESPLRTCRAAPRAAPLAMFAAGRIEAPAGAHVIHSHLILLADGERPGKDLSPCGAINLSMQACRSEAAGGRSAAATFG